MTSGMLFSNLSWNLITAERPHMCAIAWLSLQQCVQNLEVGACWVCCPGHWIIFSGRAGLAPGVVSGIGLTHKFDKESSREWFHYRTLWAYIMVHPWVTMIACTHNVPQWIVQDQSISSLTLNLCVQWHVLRNTTYNILQGCWDYPVQENPPEQKSSSKKVWPRQLGQGTRSARPARESIGDWVISRGSHGLGQQALMWNVLRWWLPASILACNLYCLVIWPSNTQCKITIWMELLHVDLVSGSLWWWSSWRTCVQSCWEMCCIIDVLTISHSRIMEHYFERWHVTIYYIYINI